MATWSTTATPPPSTASKPARGRPAKATVAKSSESLANARMQGITGLAQIGGAICELFGQYHDAGAIYVHSGPIATELVKLADSNDTVASALDKLNETGPYAGLVLAVTPFILQILTNHKILKGTGISGMNIRDPQELTAEVQTVRMVQRAESLKRQKEAQENLRQAERDLAESAVTA